MAKPLLHPSEREKLHKLNPFLRYYFTTNLKEGFVRKQICQLTNWKTGTFYNRLRYLGLTEQEANAVASVLSIPHEEMLSWEGFYKT